MSKKITQEQIKETLQEIRDEAEPFTSKQVLIVKQEKLLGLYKEIKEMIKGGKNI